MPDPRVTIDELPEQLEPLDSDLFIVQDSGVSKKMSVAVLKTVEPSAVTAHLIDPTGAHAATAISAADSGNGIDGVNVQAQLGQLSTLAADTAESLASRDVMWVGTDAPVDPTVEVWYDPDEPAPDLGVMLPFVDVRDYGAVGDGVTDDSAALQTAIDYCVGGNVAAGASNSRIARAALYLPAGRYLTTVAPKVVSVSGFHMFGDSGYGTTIVVSGARTYGIELDGLMMCDIHDLRIVGTHGAASTDTVRDAVALNWTTAASRSTSNVRFARIFIHELKFTNGMTFGLDSSSRQVDNIWVETCLVNGQWTAGETTWWQTGFQSGNGTHGNVLNHNYQSCGSALNRYNLYANAVNVDWQGGDIGNGEVDFRHNGSMPLAVNGLRSEGSQRLYESNGGSSFASSASLSNILFNGSGIAADQRFIKIQYGGTYLLENVALDATPTAPKIYIANAATKPTYITAIGLQTRSLLNALFESAGATAPVMVTASGYCQLDSGGLPEAAMGKGLWVKGFQAVGGVTFEDVEIDGALDHDGTTAGFYGTTPVTRPSAVSAAAALNTLGLGTGITDVGATVTLGNNVTAVASAMILNAPTGQTNTVQYNRGGTAAWWLYDANSTLLFLRDMVNGVMHMTVHPGTAAGSGRVELGVKLTVPAATVGIENGSGGPQWRAGSGTPEGVVIAPVGSLFSRTDGGAGTSLYVKQSGAGTGTGWAAVTP